MYFGLRLLGGANDDDSSAEFVIGGVSTNASDTATASVMEDDRIDGVSSSAILKEETSSWVMVLRMRSIPERKSRSYRSATKLLGTMTTMDPSGIRFTFMPPTKAWKEKPEQQRRRCSMIFCLIVSSETFPHITIGVSMRIVDVPASEILNYRRFRGSPHRIPAVPRTRGMRTVLHRFPCNGQRTINISTHRQKRSSGHMRTFSTNQRPIGL